MKILFYNHTGQVSGAERVLQMILTGIHRDAYERVVACPDQSKMFELAATTGASTRGLRALEARFTWRPDRLVQYLLSFARVIREARALVVAEAPDAIHANSIRAGIVMAAATVGLRTPVIWHAHDILPRHPLSTLVRLFAAVSSRNRILAVSHAVAKRFRGRLLPLLANRVKIDVIHNAVDLERFHPNANVRAEIRQELDLSDTDPVIGSVGQLTSRKGQLELIKAFAPIARKLPDAVLLIAGEPLFNRDEEYAKRLRDATVALGITDRISFLGARNDVPDLMQAFDVLAVNSHEEPFALTVLEGLASGITVLATAVGGTPEMIKHGENGWLVPPREIEPLARSLFDLLHDPKVRARLGRRARQTAVARFSTNSFLREINSLYADVIAPKAAKETQRELNEKLAID